MPVTSAQVRMARAALNWTVWDLAEATNLHRNTISNIETGRYAGDPATLAAIAAVLKRAGVEFIEENGAALVCVFGNTHRSGSNSDQDHVRDGMNEATVIKQH